MISMEISEKRSRKVNFHTSKLFLQDIYNLMEKWRHLLAKEFNFAQDESIQRLSKRILSDEAVTSSFARETEEQFPGIIALLPAMFHISEQIVTKLKDLIPKTGWIIIFSYFLFFCL